MLDRNTEQSYRTIVNRLRSLALKWRMLLIFQCLLLCLGVMAVSLSVTLAIDQLVPMPRILRLGLVLLVLGIGVYTLIFKFIRPAFGRITVDRVAAYVEQSYPGFENRILSAIQLQPEIARNRFGYALEFINRLTDQARQSIEEIKIKRVFDRECRNLKKYGGFAICSGTLFIAINLVFSSAMSDFLRAFEEIPMTPRELLTTQIHEVNPGNIRIKSGTDVTVSTHVTGHLNAPVYLYYSVRETDVTVEPTESSEESWKSVLMTKNDEQIDYRVTVENVTYSTEYYVKTKEAQSEPYKITVTREPILSRFQLKLNFPKYTHLASQVLEENLGDVTALIGTEVQFEAEANKPLSSGNKLVFDESEPVRLKTTEQHRLAGSFIIQTSEKYRTELIDTHGLTNPDPIHYTINAVRDAEPMVELIEPNRDVVLDDSMIARLKINAKDDYGLERLQLVYEVEGNDENPVVVPLKQWGTQQTEAYIEFSWDTDPIGLFPGDVISYHVEAIDTDNVTGPNIGKSDTHTLRFPYLDELYAAIETSQEVEQTGLEILFEEQSEAIGIVDELLDKIRKNQELTAKDEQLMQQVLETQRQIKQTAEELVESMKKTADQMQANELFELETVKKYQELQELMEEALSEEHKELLRKLSEALEQQQLSDQERELMDANFSQEQFLQQLDQLKELYKQMILQNQLEKAAKLAEELVERQQRLLEKAEEYLAQANRREANQTTGPQQELDRHGDELAKQEKRIAQEMEELHSDLDELGREMSKHDNLKRVADEIDRLNQFARNDNVVSNLEDASRQMARSQLKQAMQPGIQAQDTMSDLAQGLENALEFMEGTNADETLTALRAAVRSGVYLSEVHEGVIEDTNEILRSGHGQYIDGEIERLQILAAEELSTAIGIDQLADRLWELGKQQMQIDPKVVWRLNEASDALNRAASALEDRKANLATTIQKQGLADLNQAVVDLLGAMNQMNQQMGIAGMENMLEQLQQLAQSQGQLNEMTQNLNQQMRQQGRTPGLEQMLKRMGYEQQLIREATERLAEMMEKFSQALGDLQGVAEDMKKVEMELEGGNVDQNIVKKQRQILTRMLESAKSLQKRDVSKKRQSKLAKTPMDPVRESPSLDPKLLSQIQELESNLRSGGVETLPLEYREQIERYFKALSQQTRRKSTLGE
ncbi:MAG: hypothetical protein OXI86_05095 [Candidatus Poribacteria bacterium]|nr:hypothetical protein [Candidatus Poribacteria bacterium]